MLLLHINLITVICVHACMHLQRTQVQVQVVQGVHAQVLRMSAQAEPQAIVTQKTTYSQQTCIDFLQTPRQIIERKSHPK